jgi:hypothetical protein
MLEEHDILDYTDQFLAIVFGSSKKKKEWHVQNGTGLVQSLEPESNQPFHLHQVLGHRMRGRRLL